MWKPPIETSEFTPKMFPFNNPNNRHLSAFLVLRGDLVTGDVLDHLLGDVAERHHAHGLPHTQADTGHDTAVKAFDAGLAVDVFEGVADGHLLGPVRVVFFALHLDTHDFNGLVPGGETTTKCGCKNLFGYAELDRGVFLAGDFADTGFAGMSVSWVIIDCVR